MSELLEALESTAQMFRDGYQLNPDPVELPGPNNWYEWFIQPGGIPRTKCKEHGIMSWAMKIDRRYPDTPNKHTLSYCAHPVIYLGRPVQVWECRPCGKWVVK